MPTFPHWRCLAAASAAQQLQATEPANPAPRGAYISPLLPDHQRKAASPPSPTLLGSE